MAMELVMMAMVITEMMDMEMIMVEMMEVIFSRTFFLQILGENSGVKSIKNLNFKTYSL